MSHRTSSFAFAAAITVVFNTLLACAKDAYAPLNHFMDSILGHNWTTQGAADLLLFIALGFIFTKMEFTARMNATPVLIGSVAASALGLFFWYVFF